MARRHPKPHRSAVLEYRQLPSDELRRRIERCRETGELRTAIEMAKECHRRDPSAVYAQLLGELYVRRGRQLLDKNLHTEALMVLNNALAWGQGSAELLHMVFECGLRDGQYSTAVTALNRLQDPDERRRALLRLADEAVAVGDPAERLCDPAIREDVRSIRRAFAGFEAGDDASADAALKRVGLKSPCAAWKWLVLGLMAYARGEEDRAASCWDRVGTDGRAGQLGKLLASVLVPRSDARSPVPSEVRTKIVGLFGSPRVALLQQIKDALDADSPQRALELCSQLRAKLKPDESGAYTLRLARSICAAITSPQVANRFSRVFSPPPEDPYLLRSGALALEKKDPLQAVALWTMFLERLNDVKAIPPQRRARARALVWQRMGDLAAEEAGNELGLPTDLNLGPSDDCGAIGYYRKSLAIDPADLRTHEKLIDILVRLNHGKEAERQATQLLERRPAHVSALLLLGERCLRRDAFRKALNYFDRARQAEPFNDQTRRLMELCYLLSARRRLEKGNLILARQDYQQAADLASPTDPSGHVYRKWAALEWRAGESSSAEALVKRSFSFREAPLLAYFELVIELERADAPEDVRERFGRLLQLEWAGSPSAATAVALVGHVRALDLAGARFASREAHLRELHGYLLRAINEVRFSEEQLLSVCSSLEGERAWKELEVFAHHGVEQCPGDYYFPLHLAQAQLRGGRRRLPRATRKRLRAAERQAAEARNLEVATRIALLLDDDSGGWRPSLGSMLDMLDAAFDGGEIPDLDAPDVPRKRRRRGARHREQPELFDDLFDLVEDA